jgi:uncharacterized protein (DUF2235 family)
MGLMPTLKERPGQHRRKRKLLYMPGIGAEAKGIPKYLAQVFGKTVGVYPKLLSTILQSSNYLDFFAVEMVLKAYMFISRNYRPGDSVW